MPGEGYIFETYFRGVAQHGSVLEWGSSGRWFESSRPDQKLKKQAVWSAFLIVPACGAEM
jgi:hypothetical protein